MKLADIKARHEDDEELLHLMTKEGRLYHADRAALIAMVEARDTLLKERPFCTEIPEQIVSTSLYVNPYAYWAWNKRVAALEAEE